MGEETTSRGNDTNPAELTPPSAFLAPCPKFRVLVLGNPESTKQELFSRVFGVDLEKVSASVAFSTLIIITSPNALSFPTETSLRRLLRHPRHQPPPRPARPKQARRNLFLAQLFLSLSSPSRIRRRRPVVHPRLRHPPHRHRLHQGPYRF